MSRYNDPTPTPGNAASIDAIETIIVPSARDLGGFEVRRVLPAPKRQMVGPFIFFDQMGPAEFITGQGIDVRPHPHIGLATVTYLFEGQIVHKDSLGTDMEIKSGDVNLMAAGRGIVHSERSGEKDRQRNITLAGIQSWIALPEAIEESTPEFWHYGKKNLPTIEDNGTQVRIIMGSLYGETAPVKTFSEMFYADVMLQPGSKLPIAAEHEERGIYIVEGAIEISGITYDAGRLLVLHPLENAILTAKSPARLMLMGGESMDGPRHIWWNFVSSSKERIEQAKEEWRTGQFDTVPGDEEEFIPLP
jgi:redox-sensitive bicupin YhaK (pirin superfamily)